MGDAQRALNESGHRVSQVRRRGAAVILMLGLMVLVPITALGEQRPSPFGWHMYASNVDVTAIEVTTADGKTESRSLGDLAAKLRPEPDYAEPLAQFICTREPDVRSVRLTRDVPFLDEEFSCASF